MLLQLQAGSHHRDTRRKWRARRNSRPRCLGKVDMPQGQMAEPKLVLNRSITWPPSRQSGQPGQGRYRLSPGHVALRLLPIGPQTPDVGRPESPTSHQKSDQEEPPSPQHLTLPHARRHKTTPEVTASSVVTVFFARYQIATEWAAKAANDRTTLPTLIRVRADHFALILGP
jgi:hypothetical protein